MNVKHYARQNVTRSKADDCIVNSQIETMSNSLFARDVDFRYSRSTDGGPPPPSTELFSSCP